MRFSAFFLWIIAFFRSLLLAITGHNSGINIQCEIVKAQIVKEPTEKMMAYLLICCLSKFAKITLICVLSGCVFPVKIFPKALSERVISVCKKRVAPHQMPVIKLSKMTEMSYARLESCVGSDEQFSMCSRKLILSNICFKNTIPPQGVISLLVKDNSNSMTLFFLSLSVRILNTKLNFFFYRGFWV